MSDFSINSITASCDTPKGGGRCVTNVETSPHVELLAILGVRNNYLLAPGAHLCRDLPGDGRAARPVANYLKIRHR